MPVDTAAGLTDALRRHRLLEPAQLAELDRFQGAFPAPRALAGELVRRSWLTPYQANQLLQDRGRDLLLGSYVLLERLGEGGMGEVFKARNWKLGQIVALKLIRKVRLDNPDAVRRFQREIRAAAQLDHPNIVRAFDADEVNGAHLLVMEYVQGTDLAKLVKKGGPLAVDKACDYARQAALGLQHACERGLVHRDVKPHNLLLTAAGVVKILDMGLARLDRRGDDEASSTMTREGAVMGTLDYISPEQAMDSHDVDIRADLYSLGCTLYFLLTGKVPFPGGEALQKLLKHRLDEPVPVEQLRPDVPPSVAAVVRKLMAKRPEDRYQTPVEAAAALAASGRAKAAPVVTAAAGATGDVTAGWSSMITAGNMDQTAIVPRRRRRTVLGRPWIWLGAAIGVVVLGLGLMGLIRLLPRGPKPPPPEHSSPAPEVKQDKPEDAAATDFDKWVEQVATLSPWKQTGWVAAKLKERNPGFDGTVKPTIENGVVTELRFNSDRVTDISPVRALAGLKSLRCDADAFGKGRVSDLSPLKGTSLAHLYCNNNKVSDLSPLRGMPLKELHCNGNQISDLGPLAGMELTSLNCGGNPITDLSPLKGMPLEVLWCHYTRVSDLAPLKGMPLKQLLCDFNAERDAGILHSIKTLERINSQPAADFWKAVGDAPPKP